MMTISQKYPNKISNNMMKTKIKNSECIKDNCNKNIQVQVKVRAYKVRNFVVDLIEYLKSKENFWVTQNELMNALIEMGYSRSYIYMRIKKYTQGIVKSHFGETDPDILEPLLLEKSRLEFDGILGIVYRLNDCWKIISKEEIIKAFNGN